MKDTADNLAGLRASEPTEPQTDDDHPGPPAVVSDAGAGNEGARLLRWRRTLRPSPVSVFLIRLRPPAAELKHKMSVPELCRNFSVIAVLDADFHSLPSTQQRQQHGPSLDRIKCRLLEGTNAQDVRALVLDMQARLLLDMLGKGIETALVNPATLIPEPWQASGETLSGIEADAMAVEQH